MKNIKTRCQWQGTIGNHDNIFCRQLTSLKTLITLKTRQTRRTTYHPPVPACSVPDTPFGSWETRVNLYWGGTQYTCLSCKMLAIKLLLRLTDLSARKKSCDNLCEIICHTALHGLRGWFVFTCKHDLVIVHEPTESSKQPIRTRYLGHVTGYQPIRDQYSLIRSVPGIIGHIWSYFFLLL